MDKKVKIPASIFLFIVILCGMLLLFFGIKNTIQLNQTSNHYHSTEGYFVDYTLYSEGGYDAVRHKHTNDTYQLIYQYTVNGQDYTVATDYGSGVIPEIGSTKQIKYDPNAPENAIIVGTNSDNAMVFIGFLFVVIPLFMFLVMIRVSGKFIRIWAGMILLIVGYGALSIMAGSFSPVKIIEFFFFSFTLFLFIPILLIVVGVFILIVNLFFDKVEIQEEK